jgi:hypothetical protein
MESSFGLNFFLKKNNHDRNKKSVIYMRLTVDGEICDISTRENAIQKNGTGFQDE